MHNNTQLLSFPAKALSMRFQQLHNKIAADRADGGE